MSHKSIFSRVRFLASEAKYKNNNPNRRRSLPEAFNLRTNDYDINSGRFVDQRTQQQFQDTRTYLQSTKPPLKVYQPREDPRLFYQTDAYRKEIMGKNVNNNQVTFAYPGNEVVRITEQKYSSIQKPFKKRLRDIDQKVIMMKGEEVLLTLKGINLIKLNFIQFSFLNVFLIIVNLYLYFILTKYIQFIPTVRVLILLHKVSY